MAVIDEILTAVNASTKLDTSTKSILAEFLQTAGPAIAALAPTEFNALIARFANGDTLPAASADAAPHQIVTLLDATQQAMDTELQQRAAQTAATHAAVSALQNAAISILSKLVIAAL